MVQFSLGEALCVCPRLGTIIATLRIVILLPVRTRQGSKRRWIWTTIAVSLIGQIENLQAVQNHHASWVNDTGLLTHMFANSLGGYIRSLPSHCSSLALCLTHSLCFWISVITNLISLGESLYLEVFADLDPIWEVHHILNSKKKPHLFQCFALTSH